LVLRQLLLNGLLVAAVVVDMDQVMVVEKVVLSQIASHLHGVVLVVVAQALLVLEVRH
jgi:hypothetical protein